MTLYYFAIIVTFMQVKVSAEDRDTIHFVRDNLFDCLDHKKVPQL